MRADCRLWITREREISTCIYREKEREKREADSELGDGGR